jgi:hypothetical protein
LIVGIAMTGELLADIPVDGQHLVFALDLALLAPTWCSPGSSCSGAPRQSW